MAFCTGLATMATQAEPPRNVSMSGASKPIVPDDEPFKGVTRNNGFAFKALDNVSIESYLDKFRETMPEKHIVSASRISNNRIALYVSSMEEVADAIARGLTYGDSFLELTPLIQPTTRLTLSNVYPEIPNYVLLHNISSFCKVVSAVKPIPLRLKNKQLSHIMSFRRQVQIILKPNITLPDHIHFSHSGVNYRVFRCSSATARTPP